MSVKKVFRLLAALALVVGTFGVAVSAQVTKFRVYGKVVDQNHEPVAHAKVILHTGNVKGGAIGSDVTDKQGRYEIWHSAFSRCAVEVVPPARKGLAQTILPHVIGTQDSHLIVSLHPGFEVSGKVVWKGQGLRGVAVAASSAEDDAIHTGSVCLTDKHGNYHLFLTPGEKRFEVYPATFAGEKSSSIMPTHEAKPGEYYPKIYTTKFQITQDQALPDIVIPEDAIQIVAK